MLSPRLPRDALINRLCCPSLFTSLPTPRQPCDSSFLGGDGSTLLYQITTPWGRDHSPCWLNRTSAALGKVHSRSNKKRGPPYVQWHRSLNPLAGVMGTAVWHKGQGHELPRISRLYDLDPSSTTASCGASGKFLHLTMPQFSPSANRDNNISLSYRNTEG